jgi:peptidoglycan glycosyltransferase
MHGVWNGGASARARRAAAEGRWRRAQLARRRRLTLRGRLTIAGGLLGIGLVIGWIVDPISPVLAALERPDVPVGLPAVSAGAPPVRTPVEPPLVPDPVLARLPITREALELPSSAAAEGRSARLYEEVDVPAIAPDLAGPLRVEYSLDAELTRHVFSVLRKGRVKLGNVVLLDPTTGRVLAYASTDLERFPPTRTYPAASLVKIITAAAALDLDPQTARLPCRYRGSPYRLTPSRIDPPEHGRTVSLRRALATSNNQCFAQLAVHAVGQQSLLDAIGRFGWLSVPAVAHAAGAAETGDERYDVGRLGCGLAGCRITPLHAAQLAASLVHGELVTPRWIERVTDAEGRELRLPAPAAPRRVLPPDLTAELRSMLVDTTRSGTARSAFRDRRGRPLLGPVKTAGKTGSLSGKDPDGRYEWFIGVAPAESPRVAVATVLVQGDLWWRSASQVAADVLRGVFCEKRACSEARASRYIQVPSTTAALATVPAALDEAP